MSKPSELREQTTEQLDLQLKEVQSNLFRLRLQSETERFEAPSEIVKAKREVARIKTIVRLRRSSRKKPLPYRQNEKNRPWKRKRPSPSVTRPEGLHENLSQLEPRGFRCVR